MSWWSFRTPSQKQSFVSDFLQVASREIPGIRQIDQLTFVVLDTETSGLNPREDEVLSFGAIKIHQGSIRLDTAVEFYPESFREPGSAAAVHGLVGRPDTRSTRDFSDAVLSFLGGGILVGHHVNFDLEMLLKVCRPFGLKAFPNPVLDTMNLAIRLDHGPRSALHEVPLKAYSLDALCERFHIPMDDRHTAGGDAFLTAQLLLKLLKEAEKKGIQTYQDLFR